MAAADCFLQADTDNSGTLDRREFKELLNNLDINLTAKDIRAILSEADTNDDGVLDYKEFLPIMTQLVYAMRAKNAVLEARKEEEEAAQAAVESYMLRGVPRDTLMSIMFSVFQGADADGSGALSRKEFQACLKNAKLGLSRKDINLLMAEADLNEDGLVSYDEFVPLCFDILVERFKYDMLQNKSLQSNDELTSALLEAFQARCVRGGGAWRRPAPAAWLLPRCGRRLRRAAGGTRAASGRGTERGAEADGPQSGADPALGRHPGPLQPAGATCCTNPEP